jgi:hypothetical protein
MHYLFNFVKGDGVVRITAGEYDTVLAVAAGRGTTVAGS